MIARSCARLSAAPSDLLAVAAASLVAAGRLRQPHCPTTELSPLRLPGVRVEPVPDGGLAAARAQRSERGRGRPGRTAQPTTRSAGATQADVERRPPRRASIPQVAVGRERPARLGLRARRTLQRLRGRRVLDVSDRARHSLDGTAFTGVAYPPGDDRGELPLGRCPRHGAARRRARERAGDRRCRSRGGDRDRGPPERGVRRPGGMPVRALRERARRRRPEALPDRPGLARLRPARRTRRRADRRIHRPGGRRAGRGRGDPSWFARRPQRTWFRRTGRRGPRSPRSPAGPAGAEIEFDVPDVDGGRLRGRRRLRRLRVVVRRTHRLSRRLPRRVRAWQPARQGDRRVVIVALFIVLARRVDRPLAARVRVQAPPARRQRRRPKS